MRTDNNAAALNDSRLSCLNDDAGWVSNSTQVSSLSLRRFSRMRFNKSTKGTTQAIISRFNSSFSRFRCWSMVRPQLHHISKFFPTWATDRCYLFLLILCSIDEGEGVLEEYFGQTCVGDAGNGRRMECAHQSMGQRLWWEFNHSVRLFVCGFPRPVYPSSTPRNRPLSIVLAAIERHPSHVTLSPTNPFSEFAISWWSTGRLMRSLSARERPWFRRLGGF
ncbi:hypothetical protein DFH08DRAFT_907065 [Mycena albidolilacea]|uniref:Uncharacterized protein n=1 Tax=Mycena albidolilacea TaxID=1033008 RepID=A0AAD7E7P4_9AGAR|nr:hypothetical protein DFH08DRAFT_907065 [Mycena albidolilacea]